MIPIKKTHDMTSDLCYIVSKCDEKKTIYFEVYSDSLNSLTVHN